MMRNLILGIIKFEMSVGCTSGNIKIGSWICEPGVHGRVLSW